MPTLSRASPDCSTPATAWPFPGMGTANGWAERLVSGSTALANPTPEIPARAASVQTGLTAAIANIVVVAAQRALAAGELPKLREAIDRAIDSVSAEVEARDPRDTAVSDLPRIADAEPNHEAGRLMSLMRSQSFA